MAFILPPTLTDTLSAVNVCLASIGEAPVNSVEATEAADVGAALNTIEEVSRAVQSEGWSWNRDEGLMLSPDNTSRVPIPDTTLRVVKAYPGNHTDLIGERSQAGVRFLYDRGRHSFVFEDAVMVDLVSKFQFEDLPEAARRYITIRAAKLFQGRVQTNALVDRITDDEVYMARATLEQHEDEAAPTNSIRGNAETSYRLNGRGLRRRS